MTNSLTKLDFHVDVYVDVDIYVDVEVIVDVDVDVDVHVLLSHLKTSTIGEANASSSGGIQT